MRILACHNYYQWRGGEDQSYDDEVQNLRSHGHTVVTHTIHNDAIDDMSKIRVAAGTLWNQQSYRDIRALIRAERPDVLHCTNSFPLLSPSILHAAQRERVPVVQALRNFRTLCAGAYFLRDGRVCEDCINRRIALPAVKHRCYRGSLAGSTVVTATQSLHRLLGTWHRKVDAFFTLTEFARQKLLHLGMSPEQVFVKYNCVLDDPGLGNGESDFAVFAGRLSAEKGIESLLDAFDRPSCPLRLKVFGEGPLLEKVQRCAANNSRIEALGSQPLNAVLEAMGQAKCVVMTSLWYETFGRTIIEGYAKGTPLIAPRLGAMQELVEDGETGFLFDPGNADDLAEKLHRLTSHPELYKKMRTEVRHRFEQHFTAESNYQRLMQIYQFAIDRHATRKA